MLTLSKDWVKETLTYFHHLTSCSSIDSTRVDEWLVEPLSPEHKGRAFCSGGARSRLMLEGEAMTQWWLTGFQHRLRKKEKPVDTRKQGSSLWTLLSHEQLDDRNGRRWRGHFKNSSLEKHASTKGSYPAAICRARAHSSQSWRAGRQPRFLLSKPGFWFPYKSSVQPHPTT